MRTSGDGWRDGGGEVTVDDDITAYVAGPVGRVDELITLQARAAPERIAVIDDAASVTWAAFAARIDRIAASLQRDGVGPDGVVAICALSAIDYACAFIATVRIGAAVAPLSPSSTADQLAAMIADCGASHLFLDAATGALLASVLSDLTLRTVGLGEGAPGTPIDAWLAPDGSQPEVAAVDGRAAFNIIYSSGTTGTPKGIVQSVAMRWPHNHLTVPPGLGRDAVAMISTPLYSNTTLVSFLPALAGGGIVVLMAKFDAHRFLELSQQHGATHAMLVPVQYRRILALPDFDTFDLSTYRMKYATSAPFAAELKAEVLRRWPGGLIEYYGMTEGGGSCALLAHEYPDKLHTVGKPMPGHDLRVIDVNGNFAAPGVPGEVVGRSGAMMTGYHNAPAKTAEAEWYSPEGDRYIRTGDIASIDADGFFTLIGRAKDMIISGGINLYPVDLEAALKAHPAVDEAAVIGVPSAEWGETPVAFVTIRQAVDPETLRTFANASLGKMQRISAVHVVDELPRSAIGKVLKRELQDRYRSAA